MLLQVLGAASSVISFIAAHPYPIYNWNFLDYVAGNYSNLQAGTLCTCNDVLLLMLQMCSPALLACKVEGN